MTGPCSARSGGRFPCPSPRSGSAGSAAFAFARAGAGGRPCAAPAPGGAATAGGLCCVLAAHRGRAFALSAGPDPRLALFLLLGRLAARFLLLGPRIAAALLFRALIFGGARLAERYGDRPAPALHLAALAFRSLFQLAMRKFMHDPSDALHLPGCGFGHGGAPFLLL